MKKIIKENNWLTFYSNKGWGNGYVLLPKEHKYYGTPYDDIPVDVHYGLTFSELVTEEMISEWPELSIDDLDGWLIGFDTCHHGDSIEKWPKDAVQAEADRLAAQLLTI